jgi:hypothetical protein
MSIDIYTTRAMAAALEVGKTPKNFLRTLTVGRPDEFSNTEQVDVDVKIGARRLAPFVNPNKGVSKAVDRIGFNTLTHTAPMIAEKRPITGGDLRKRMPGETVYTPQTAEQRAAQLLTQDLKELDELIARREEWMCAQMAFNTGTVSGVAGTSIHVLGDDIDYYITFPRSAEMMDTAPTASPAHGLADTVAPTSTQLANSERWDQSTAHIVTQIRQMRRRFQKRNGMSPDYMVLGEDAADALLSAPSLVGQTGLLSTLRMDLGQISPDLRDNGATFIGSFKGTGIDLWAYDEWYIDPADGVEKALVPAKSILMGSSKSYVVMRYGAVDVAEGVDDASRITSIAGRRIPESWINKEPAVRFVKVSSRPLVVPVQNDAFLTCQVLS